MRVLYDIMYGEFYRILIKKGFSDERAALSAELFADASRDGVYTHGLNRFVKFLSSMDKGSVDIHAEPVLKEAPGVLERYDGKRGPGNLNAFFCMKRAVELAKKQTIGCVSLSNTNHWMRPGNYGLMAASENCIGILWTNTVPNMPPWGGRDAKLGNNPVVFAIPHGDTPVLVDVAMSMFSYGKLEAYARAGKELPVDGGFDREQKITKDAGEILKTHQSLPIGYWKGSGLSLALDLIAAVLAGGKTSRQVGELPAESGLSQVFLAISLDALPDKDKLINEIEETLKDLKSSQPVSGDRPVYFPGENMMKTRRENMELGIPVDEEIWNQVLCM
nr:3-dehydro-L-gulonate 2-dehydrogenase [uncultured Clostridium sp.]